MDAFHIVIASSVFANLGSFPSWTLANLRTVCHAWRELTLLSPTLWAYIQDGDLTYLSLLCKSENARLYIEYRGFTDAQSFFHLVNPAREQWRTFFYYPACVKERELGNQFIRGPLLETFIIHNNLYNVLHNQALSNANMVLTSLSSLLRPEMTCIEIKLWVRVDSPCHN